MTDQIGAGVKSAASVEAPVLREVSNGDGTSLNCPTVGKTARGNDVKTMTETTLAEFIENGAVTGITIKETSEGFTVLVAVAFDKSAQYLIITQKAREPKLWSSLTRLVQHLGRYPNVPTIELELRTSNAARKPSKQKQHK